MEEAALVNGFVLDPSLPAQDMTGDQDQWTPHYHNSEVKNETNNDYNHDFMNTSPLESRMTGKLEQLESYSVGIPPADPGFGLLFPSEGDHDNWNMPGAFRDAMEIDPPAFTVELEAYFSGSPKQNVMSLAAFGMADSTFADGFQPDGDKHFRDQYREYGEYDPHHQKLNDIDENHDETYYGQGYGQATDFNMGQVSQIGQHEAISASIPSEKHSISVNDTTINFNDHNNVPSYESLDSNPFLNHSQDKRLVQTPQYQQDAPTSSPGDSLHPYVEENRFLDWRDTHSHRTSISAAGGDLLPLTTTTSLTPSVSSLHLTQPSFFSAHQFFRPLLEQPPLVHRPSIDVYLRHRLSVDSLSLVGAPVRNPRLFASYFPFMGDRKVLPGAEWQPPPPPQSRHLIRSIFKSNDGPDKGVAGDPMEDEYMEVSDEDMDEEPKRAKRPKRGLFNRFKAKQETEKLEKERGAEKHECSSVASSESALLHPSSNSALSSLPNSLQITNSTGLVDQAEPDYAALFQNMGKRRNLVGMKGKKKEDEKRKPDDEKKGKEYDLKVEKPESKNEELHLHNEDSQLGAGDYSDTHLGPSITNSHDSSVSGESGNTPGTFASASKRILGSRLLKRKSSLNRVSDVVEVDLKALDLPPDTEIISGLNPKSRTRGRKEDKAADMVDTSKIFVCSYCLRRFKRQEHLKRHFRSLHTSEKPYECPICLKKFSRTDNLNQHLKVHKQEEEEAAAAAAAAASLTAE